MEPDLNSTLSVQLSSTDLLQALVWASQVSGDHLSPGHHQSDSVEQCTERKTCI